MSEAPELLLCPFCGGEACAKADHTTEQCHTVFCTECHLWVADHDEEWSCITYWNTRSDTTTPPEVVEKMREALKVAEQLATVASDWNLDEVEIDGEMQDIYDVRDVFRAALASLEEGK